MRLGRVAAVLWLASVTAAVGEPWSDWDRMLARQCPARHANWVCDDCWLDLTAAFERTLAPAIRKQVQTLGDPGGRCSDTVIGNACQMGERLQAYERLRLSPAFTAFACRAVKCERIGSCSRFPGQARSR
jgi:hypothetical protein